jgi:hypothetical protein
VLDTGFTGIEGLDASQLGNRSVERRAYGVHDNYEEFLFPRENSEATWR